MYVNILSIFSMCNICYYSILRRINGFYCLLFCLLLSRFIISYHLFLYYILFFWYNIVVQIMRKAGVIMKDMDRALFRELLLRAIGTRTRADFANSADVSVSGINRWIQGNTNFRTPRSRTLVKLAEASEGRVTEDEFLSACGYAVRASAVPGAGQDENIRVALDYKEWVEMHAGSAMKYVSIAAFLDSVSYLDGRFRTVNRIWSTVPYEHTDHRGAEMTAFCSATWRKAHYESRLDFALMFCFTGGGGAIISDVVFDPSALGELGHPMAEDGRFAMEPGSPIALTCSPCAYDSRLTGAFFRK